MKIVTQNVCPPIPIRNFDWQAYDADTYDGPGSPLGEGPTEQAAITDLLEQLAADSEPLWSDSDTAREMYRDRGGRS